ncbi:MAG TPA: thioredoxin domain-containing protein, partial [Polyangiaceae bacterium]|nr:thioredoxin domain-containing protein [Polyangiaceae bacterium]
PPNGAASPDESSDTAGIPVKKLAHESVPVPPADQPSKGPLRAPVVLQIWSDFECPFCARAVPILAELEHEFGAELRIVWRAMPLPAHSHSQEAAAAALEAYSERGGAAFWRVHDRLFAEAADGLDEAKIERSLKAEGVDVMRYRLALKSGSHDAAIAADVKAGDFVEGTPAFLINDYYVFGIAPIEVFRSLVQKAQSEAKAR